MLTRRATLTGLGFALASTSSLPALAAGDQAEWLQNYDAGSTMRVQRSTTPILSQQALAATEQMIERYRDIVARGGWQPVAGAERLRVGSKGPAVSALRQRLIITGDLDPAGGTSPVYDSYVEAAVRRFQARHGLGMTGSMNATTVQAMNVRADVRMRQLEVNAVRLRSYSGNLGHRFVIVNIPAALVETVEDGRVMTRHAAGVGKIDRQSPIMNAKIVEINFNPFWTVPASIIKKDLIPRMQKEPSYLSDNKIRIFNGDTEIQPSQVNWRSDEATRYRFRQDPGVDLNSMGFVRINIPNPHGVYMHDTPAKGIFGDDFRFVSSGCVRVQNVREYVAWILKDNPGWDLAKIEETIQGGQRIDARPAQPVPVFWTYITAWSTPDGLVQFRDDIYQRDGVGAPGAMASAAQAPASYDEEPTN